MIGPIVLAVVMIATGAMSVIIGQRGTAGRLDYSWGGHTKANTDPERWAETHRVCGPKLETMGWCMVAAGVIAPVLILAGYPNAGAVVLIVLTIVGVAIMFRGLLAGLRVLSTPAE